MQLKPAQPLLFTKRGCPLAFDLIDAASPDAGIIGRATYVRQHACVITYAIRVHAAGREQVGELRISTNP